MDTSTTLTRTDCKRDNQSVSCPNASLIGFGQRYCKRGYWVLFEYDNYKYVGRAISRVKADDRIWIEVATVNSDFSSAYIRWIDPNDVREVRRAPPRRVFEFFGGIWEPEYIYRALEYGVSDLNDQLEAQGLERTKG